MSEIPEKGEINVITPYDCFAELLGFNRSI